MAEGRREAVILLDKNQIFVFNGNDFLTLDVPEAVVRDIDIVDKSGFDSLVDTFIKTKKLNSAPVWLILADGICFSKDVAETDPAKIESEIKDFLDAVPFDKVISKRYRAGNGKDGEVGWWENTIILFHCELNPIRHSNKITVH